MSYITVNTTAKKINIDARVIDPFYRYKMDQLIIRVSGTNRMISTIMTNLDIVAKNLNILPIYIPKYFAYKLSTKSTKDSIAGKYNVDILSNLMESLIKNFVLCKKCNLPEYNMIITNKQITMRCNSCSYNIKIEHMNLPQKFINFVYKNTQNKRITHMCDTCSYNIERKENNTDDTDDNVWVAGTTDKDVQERKVEMLKHDNGLFLI
jgi:translation initiation factor 5